MPTFLPALRPVLQRRIGRDTRTEERRGRGEVEIPGIRSTKCSSTTMLSE